MNFILKPNTIENAIIEYEMAQTGCDYKHAKNKVKKFLDSKKKQYNYDLENVFNKKLSSFKKNHFS